MGSSEQQRIQQQMKSWAELSPQQRAAARERYKSLRQLPPDKKDEVRQRWQEYQNLPPDQKRELAARPPSTAAGARVPAPPMSAPPQGQTTPSRQRQ
jgi:hypothetical protein